MFHVVFGNLDALMGGLPAWLRITVWATVIGPVTMLLYGWLSPQEEIAAIKEKLEDSRQEMQEYTGTDFGPVLEMAKRSLSLAFEQLRVMFVPTMIAALPVIALLIWMHEAYPRRLPEPGTKLEATVHPKDALEGEPPEARWKPSQTIETRKRGTVAITWPSSPSESAPRLVASDSERTLLELPIASPRKWITKRSAWHWFFANPAGYLPADGPIDAVRLHLPHRYVTPWGPKWLRTWHALFLVVLTISAMAAKIGFDID